MVGGTGAEKLMPCAANAVKNIFKNEGKILKRTFCSQFFFHLVAQYSEVVFARYIPPLLASKPVSFLLCFPSLYFCDNRDRR
jgi:hypothetical protein